MKSITSCIKRVGGLPICGYCKGKMLKHGLSSSGKHRYRCRECHKTQVESYTYAAYTADINARIVLFTKEGLGIRSTARVLQISATTVISRILRIASNIERPALIKGKEYEVDELCTYIKRKSRTIWIVCAMERESRRVVSFSIGPRTNYTLSIVIKTLRLSAATKVFTDRLRNYRYLIHHAVHSVKRFGTNRIERENLSLRTRLKRLNRRTICFSKSRIMLAAVLALYFWS